MKELIADLRSGDEARAKRAESSLKKALPAELLPDLLALAVDKNNSLASDCASNVVASFRDNDVVADFIESQLKSKDAASREHAAWLLKNTPQTKLVEPMKACASSDAQEDVRILCLHALRNYSVSRPGMEQDFIPLWLKAIEDARPGIRGAGYECLSHIRDRKLDPVIAKALQDADPTIRAVYAPLWQKNGGRS